MVELGPVQAEAALELEQLVREHAEETGSDGRRRRCSPTGTRRWPASPRSCRATTALVLEAKARAEEAGLDEDQTANAMMEALHG